jgi:hypothetical protein
MVSVGDTAGLIQYVNERAPQLGLDPAAVLAIAHVEGWGGTTGDGGHAYGPWQDHLTDFQGRPFYGQGANNQQVQTWAWSNAGVDYVLNQMATTGKARGLSGYNAVVAIVSNYERSANIPGEIKNAWDNWYAGLKNGSTTGTTGSVQTSDPTLQGAAELVSGASTPAGSIAAPTVLGSTQLGTIATRLSSPGFWWGAGFFVLAGVLILVGLLVVFRKEVEGAVAQVGKAAAVAA